MEEVNARIDSWEHSSEDQERKYSIYPEDKSGDIKRELKSKFKKALEEGLGDSAKLIHD